MGGLTRILTVLLCLSLSEAFRLARLVTEEVADSKTVKINDGIKFENGVLVTDDPKGYRATTVKTIKTDNGIKFENGVLVRDSSTVKTTTETPTTTTTTTTTTLKTTTTATTTAKSTTTAITTNIPISDEVLYSNEAMKLMEMLTSDDNINSTANETKRFSLAQYHNYEDILELTEAWLAEFPQLVSQYSLGQTVEQREILALKIRPEVDSDRPAGLPMVKYVANMHGDESVGREMILALAEHLLVNYGTDESVTKLLNTTEIHLVPSMNPDGFERVTRNNYNEVDLNREFPGVDLLDSTEEFLFKDREPEVTAVMKWILDNPFVLAINFHDGALVANYPYDRRNVQPWTKSDRFRPVTADVGSSETPDNKEFVLLSRLYADTHKTMSKGDTDCQTFDRGITNGADWYEISGGMQDFNYLYTNCMEITVETSCVKKPLAYKLSSEWENNREAMIAYLQTAASATHGEVRDTQGRPVKDAHVEVIGKAKDIITTETGEYWRILAPGRYRIRAKKGEMTSPEVEVTIPADWLQSPGQRLDLVLSSPVSSTTPTTTPSTTTTTTTTEAPQEDGTNLYILPGICVNLSLSFTPIRSCKPESR